MAVRLESRSLSFGYGKKKVIEKISFTAEAGTFSAILGRNGSGKTTLLHTLNRINLPCSGEVFINGKATTAMDRKEIARQISLVAQEHSDIFPFRVVDLVVMGRAPFLGTTSRPGHKEYTLAMDVLRTLKADHLATKNFNTISGGERQIALLAAALAQTTQVMLLDEPTNHLDFNNQYHLLSTIKTLCRRENLCVVASMHDPNMAMLFADQVLMIQKGTIVNQGKAADIMTKENIDRLYQLNTSAIDISREKRLFLPTSVL